MFCFRAMTGCKYVLHVASPFPIVADDSTVDIAVDGTYRVLLAASKAKSVEKVVLTSSCAAINGLYFEAFIEIFKNFFGI